MADDYVGREIRIAGPGNAGDITPHIEIFMVQAEGTRVVYRADFQNGPLNNPVYLEGGDELDVGESRRGWKTIETLAQGMSLGAAVRFAQTEAEKRKVVVYDNDIVVWHPEGWKPLGVQ